MEEQNTRKTFAATGAYGIPTEVFNQDQQQQQQQRRLDMKEDIPPVLGAKEKGPALAVAGPDLNFFTFAMPSNHDDRSIASTITMSTMITDHSASVDVFDFSGETLGDGDAAAADYDQASQATPDGGCFRFETVMDSVFVKMYEVFVDEDAMMFACQDEPSECTPILEYNSLPDIPAVISMTQEETMSESSQSLQSGNLDVDPSSFKVLDGQSTPTSQLEMASKNSETTTIEKTRALPEWDTVLAARATAEEVTEKHSDVNLPSPWRLDSILSSSPDRKDECIEVRAAGQVAAEASTVPLNSTLFPPTTPETVPKPVTQWILPPVEKTTLVPSPSFTKFEPLFSPPAPFAMQSPLCSSDNSNASKSISSKKRSLGLRYLFSPRLRKLNVLPWKRRSLQKYQNMQTMDDPSYSPETVTTLEPSTLHSDALSFQCDMSLKTSSIMSLKTTSILLKQDLHPVSQRRIDDCSLSYTYPQSMVA
jgi:hypothetical protein